MEAYPGSSGPDMLCGLFGFVFAAGVAAAIVVEHSAFGCIAAWALPPPDAGCAFGLFGCAGFCFSSSGFASFGCSAIYSGIAAAWAGRESCAHGGVSLLLVGCGWKVFDHSSPTVLFVCDVSAAIAAYG